MERWVCKNCNKKWIFPVTKCVYCKGEVLIEKSNKLKVIGLTKVYVPSPMHPIVPYNILILEDEHGNKIPKKTMKDYKLGDIYESKSSTSDNSVAIVRIKYDLREAVENATDLIGGLNLNDGSKVLIKPNIESPSYPYLSIDTNPNILDVLIKNIISLGVKKDDITVAENVFYGSFDDNVKRSGISAVCKKNNIRILDLSKTEFVKREVNKKVFEISKEIFSNDTIINLPVLKTSTQLGISGAIENMLRVVNLKTHMQMCEDGLGENMILLNKILPKYVTIGDASNGLQGQGPLHLGESAFLNLVFASNDPVALDTIFSEIGILPKPKYLDSAENLGIGCSDLNKIEVLGEETKSVQYGLKKPEQPIMVHPNINAYGENVCNLCFNSIMELSKLAGVKGFDIDLVIGKDFDEKKLCHKDRIVAFGDAAIKKLQIIGIKPIAEFKGHPPDMAESLMLLKKLIEKENGSLSIFDKTISKVASKIRGL